MNVNEKVYKTISALVNHQHESGTKREYEISFADWQKNVVTLTEKHHHSMFDIDKLSAILNELPATWYMDSKCDKPRIIIIHI